MKTMEMINDDIGFYRNSEYLPDRTISELLPQTLSKGSYGENTRVLPLNMNAFQSLRLLEPEPYVDGGEDPVARLVKNRTIYEVK